MIKLIEKLEKIDELNYGEIIRKQDSITSLFPTFHNRVKQVAKSGGVRLSQTQPGTWQFRIKSAGDNNHWYDAYVHFRDFETTLKNGIKDVSLWKKDKSGIDLRKVAAEVLQTADMELVCGCPADLYYGGQYIRTQRGAKYTNPENRPPNKKNPKKYGMMCKHLQLLFDVLPFYASTMSTFIKNMYDKEVEAAEAEVLKTIGGVKKAADFLKGKEEDEQGGKKVAKKIAKKSWKAKAAELPEPEPEPEPEEPEEEKPEDDQEPEEDKKKKKDDDEDEETRESVRRACQSMI